MLKNLAISITILLITSYSYQYSQVNSDWQWSHPQPQGNDIRFIKMISPTQGVAVGYTGTLMRTTNGGLNWMVYSNYFGTYVSFLGQGKNIYGADFYGNTGVAAGTQGWLARTTNGGANWDSVGSSAGTTALWGASFGDANTVYVGGNSGLVIKSVNGGASFTTVSSPSSGANRSVFALDANTVFTGTANGVIHKSTNGGSSWNLVSTGSTTSIIFGIYFFNSNTGFVCGGTSYVRYTTDGGTNWNVPSVTPAGTEIRLYGRKNPDEVYILGDLFNLIRTTNYGSSWSAMAYQYPGQPIGLTSNTMDITGSTMLVGGVNGLLNISTNSGSNWTGVAKVLNSWNMYDVSANHFSPQIWAVGNTAAGLNNSILHSSNNGSTWDIQASMTSGDFRSIWMTDNNNGWIVGQSGSVMKTTNGGTTWQNVTNVPSSSQTLLRVQFLNVNTGWIFGYSINSIYKTTDAGNNWVTQNSGSNDNGARWASMVDANTGYYITYNIAGSRLFKTTNGGTNWNEQSYPNQGNLWRIKMLNANTGFICGDGGRLYKTTDGSSWSPVTVPGTNNYTATDWYDVNNGVIGAGSGYSAITSNGGQSWFIKNTGGSAVWSMLMVHPDTIWCTTGFGYVFKYMRGTVGISIEWKNEIPRSFILGQNYPNPFNPNTTIEFGLPRAGRVTLTVFDITGRLVDVIIDNLNLNPGTVKTSYEAVNLSSGVYFYKLEVDGKIIDTKKMVLLK